jgi:OmpA-OmpF porin, OOP family
MWLHLPVMNKELIMKKKILCIALFGAIGAAPAAFAQDYDDRWYLAASVGAIGYDNDRNLRDDVHGSLGLGKFFSPNLSVDLDFNYSNPMFRGNELRWSQGGVGITPRWHFRGDRNWWPYLGMGFGAQRSWESFSDPAGGQPFNRKDTYGYVQPNFGLQGDYGRVNGRAEVAYRHSFDDSSVQSPSSSGFGDWIFSLGVTIALGPDPVAPIEPAAPPPPPPPPPPVQRCPDGSVMGPDGCPVPLTIDLRGVNFDFDRDTLRPDAVASLNETVSILRNYPELRVEVAGHTDLCGSETYNQGLSERRARAVYNFLTENGISSDRLVGPVGYGETRPLVSTPQTHPECRSETNRRTELNVQN